MSLQPKIKPTKKQHEAWQRLQDDTTKFVLFGGGAGGGKSWLICEWLITQCYFYPGSKWFIGRYELKRLMNSTFVTWNKVCKFHSIPRDDWKINGQYNYIEFTNGSRVDLLDLAEKPSDPDYERLGSLEYTGGAIEEAGEVKFKAFDVLKTRVGRHMNEAVKPKILITCNPTKNWVYREIYRPWKSHTLDKDYAFIQSLYKDNQHTAESYEAQLVSIKDKNTKERLMFGNWEYDDDPTKLMEYEYIIDLFTNKAVKGQKYLVADIARYGSDRTVITLWDGLECYSIQEFNLLGIDQSAALIKEIAHTENIPYSHVLVDTDGIGGGIYDILRGIKGFTNNSRPIETQKQPSNTYKLSYRNLKTQCAYMLAEYVTEHKIAVVTYNEKIKEKLVEELEQLKQKDPDKENVLEIVKKDEMKERLGRSPDILDCFIMRMYFELMPTVKRNTKSYTPDFTQFNKRLRGIRV